MPGIEFVEPDPDEGPDEDLAADPPRLRISARTKRTVRIAAGAVLAVVVGSTLVAALHSGGGTPAAAPSSAEQAPATTPPASAVRQVVICPVVDACQVSFEVPVAVVFALQARLPAIAGVTGGTVVVRGRHPTLRSRQLRAHAGRVAVRVDVRPAAERDRNRSTSSSVGVGTRVSATVIVSGERVTVTVSGPDTAVPGVGTVRALAADRRLLALD